MYNYEVEKVELGELVNDWEWDSPVALRKAKTWKTKGRVSKSRRRMPVVYTYSNNKTAEAQIS